MTYKIENDIYFKNLNIKIYEIGTSKNFIKRVFKEKKIMKDNNYDVIHINGNYCSRLFDCIAAKIAKIKKIIIHSHNTNSGTDNKIKNMIHVITKKLFDFFATDYFACSDEAAKWMFSKKIWKNKKYYFIKNGIDINKFKYNEKSRIDLRNKYNLNNKFVIGHVGRFQYQKNHRFLIDVFYEIQKKNSNSILLLIGTGEFEHEIRNKVEKLGISNKVLFLGNKEDANKYYSAMDCFALPSFFEGLGIVAIESQTSGLPTYVYKSVPEAANISKLFKKIDSLDAVIWSNEILNSEKNDRKNAYKAADIAGYSIISVVQNLELLYKQNGVVRK